MKKKLWVGAMMIAMALGLTACGEKAEGSADEGESITIDFINQTGADVGILRIRPNDKDDWSENLLQEEAWKQNYEMPVSLSGELPKPEDGWQVEMKFLNGTEEIWQGIVLEDNTTAVFSYENGVPVVKIEATEETDQTSNTGNVTE